MRRLLVGSSWKMNLTSSEARDYLEVFLSLVGVQPVHEVFVLPPFTSIWVAQELLGGTGIRWGAQDVHPGDDGSHTGDISARMLLDLGCSFVEVGHAERRRDHGEGDSDVGAKLAAVVRLGMMPILCVGEPSRCGADEASASVAVQVRAALRHAPETRGIVVAYEPVWAIGQGATAAPRERIVRIHASIRTQLGRLLPADSSIRVIYGGSVDEESARRLFSEDEIDGVFVGRAALDVRRFAAIANTHVDDIPPPAGAGTVVE